jgi:DNA-binding winged helix-turn-helix (wHTH) protein
MTACPTCGRDDEPDDQRLQLDAKARTIRRGGGVVYLPPRQWDVLMALWRRRHGTMISAERIADDVWRNAREPPDDAVKCVHVHVWRLRLVLGAVGLAIYSRHGAGNGYIIVDMGARDAA